MKVKTINIKMNIRITLFFCATILMLGSSCSKTKSYAELLDIERKAANTFLASQRVCNTIPADSIFEVGEKAPYYKLDEDGNVYMQVLKAGDKKNNKAEVNQLIYFRFMRISLIDWANGSDPTPEGNDNNMQFPTTSFRYLNYDLTSSTQYGSGVQTPLNFLGIDCEVNVVIKSQYGFSSEISSVIPYKYKIRYFKSEI
ncbi:MAG: DUF4827 family protein [Muribaculaceae bacterium]